MPRKAPFVAFVETMPDFRIEGGRVFYTPVGGGEEDLRCMPIPVFRAWIEAGQGVLREWDEHSSPPVPLKRKG